jgi:hypothetical protein
MKTKLDLLSKLIMSYLIFAASVYSQNITNTLGTGGSFTIKDASNNFLTLSQSTGQVNILKSLRLENTYTSDLGILFKESDRFLHNYGTNNTFLGVNSGNFNMSGLNNTAIGLNCLYSNTSGSFNTGLGSYSLSNNTTGSFNSGLGFQSLFTTGSDNTALGYGSLRSNVDGSKNTAVGSQSLYSNTSGHHNTAVGDSSLYKNTSGEYNAALGNLSLYSNTSGDHNTAIGHQSLYSNTIGYFNTAIGHQSLFSNTSGLFNTGIGLFALYLNTTGDHNTALGQTTGSTITTGNNLTCIGYNAQPTSGSANNQITLGNNQITSLRCNVTTITSLSDARDKKNITDLSLGLDFLMKVKPRMFNWDKREWYENNISNGSKIKEIPTAGFIAQELDEVQKSENAEWLNLVLKDNPEKLEATYGNLLPVIVKAIQELKAENDQLKENNEKLTAQVESLQLLNDKIVKLENAINELTSYKHASINKTESKIISKNGDQK